MRDQATIRISVQLDDFREPIGVVMPLSKLDPSLKHIRWETWTMGDNPDAVVYREPKNMWRENAVLIIQERERVAQKMVHAIMKAISKSVDEEDAVTLCQGAQP